MQNICLYMTTCPCPIVKLRSDQLQIQFSTQTETRIVILKEILIFTIWFYFTFHCEKPVQLHIVFFIEISKRFYKRGFIVD